jgi:hypothetical protein
VRFECVGSRWVPRSYCGFARPWYNFPEVRNLGEAVLMRVVRRCGVGLSLVLAMAAYSAACTAAAAAPDISGTYWATSYSPTIQVLGGGDPPLNAAGSAAMK